MLLLMLVLHLMLCCLLLLLLLLCSCCPFCPCCSCVLLPLRHGEQTKNARPLGSRASSPNCQSTEVYLEVYPGITILPF